VRRGNLFTNFEILLGLKSDYPDKLSTIEMNFLSDRAEDEYAKGKNILFRSNA